MQVFFNDSKGIWTPVTAVKGRCLNRLTMEPKKAPRVGLEPTTLRLTAECSTIELSRNIFYPAFQQVFFILEGYTFKTAYTITSIHASTVFFRIIRFRFASLPSILSCLILLSLEVRSRFALSNDLHTKFLWCLRLQKQVFRSNPRPISSSQLRTLLHFHLCPIYLVVFKGSY